MSKKERYRLCYAMDPPKDGIGNVYIYGMIMPSGWEWSEDDASGRNLIKQLAELGPVKRLNVHINSPGGDVDDGMSMRSALMKAQAEEIVVYVDGMCASAATLPACLPKDNRVKVVAMEGTTYMIHEPQGGRYGKARDLRSAADMLDKLTGNVLDVYASRTGLERDTLVEMVDAETWMDTAEMVEKGFADEVQTGLSPIAGHMQVVMSITKDQAEAMGYRHAPAAIMIQPSESHMPEGAEVISPGASASTENKQPKERKMKAMDMEQLKQEHPETYNQVMDAGRADGAAQERNRIQELEEMCPDEGAEMLHEAKFGEKRMTAPEFAMAMFKQQKQMAKDPAHQEQQKKQAFLEKRASETAKMQKVGQITAEESDPGEPDELEKYRQMSAKVAERKYGAVPKTGK